MTSEELFKPGNVLKFGSSLVLWLVRDDRTAEVIQGGNILAVGHVVRISALNHSLDRWEVVGSYAVGHPEIDGYWE